MKTILRSHNNFTKLFYDSKIKYNRLQIKVLGLTVYKGKEISCTTPIRTAPLLEKYIVPLHQNIGAPPKLIVEKGQTVKKGQRIAEPGGVVSVPVHSPKDAFVDDCPIDAVRVTVLWTETSSSTETFSF